MALAHNGQGMQGNSNCQQVWSGKYKVKSRGSGDLMKGFHWAWLPGIKGGEWPAPQGALETQLGTLKDPDTQATPRLMKLESPVVSPGVNIC